MDKWQRIAFAREQLGISQRELSKRAGLSPAVVNKIEAGERPNASHETLDGIARALGVTVEWLSTGEGPRTWAAAAPEEPVDVFATGERRFREWVADKEPQHLPKVSDFLKRLAEERRQRWPANVLATDVEEGLIAEFRAYRRGEWDRDEPAGVPYVPTKRGARQ